VAVDQLNTYDVVASDDVVFTQGAFDAFVNGAGSASQKPAAEKSEKPAAEKPAAEKATAKKATAKKTAATEATSESEEGDE
jgi:large subunit ribosomal protein L4